MNFISAIPQCYTWLFYIAALCFAGLIQLIYRIIRGKSL